jgi:O-antigen/teichoic acid export membrane protein
LSALIEESIDTPPSSVPWVYASTVSFLLAGGIFYLYLARVLPLGELGSVVILQAIAPIASTAISLGLGAGFNHFLSYYRARGERSTTRTLVRSSFVAAGVLALVAVAIIAALSNPLSVLFFHTDQYASTIQLLGVYVGLSTAVGIFLGVLLGLQRFVAYSTIGTFGNILTFGIPVLFYLIRPGVQSIVLGWTLGAAIELVLIASVVASQSRSGRGQLSDAPGSLVGRALYRTILLYSIPVLASNVITTGAFYVDRLVLASITSLTAVGIYNYAILIASGSLFIIAPFTTILVPRISAHFGRNDFSAIRAVTQTSSSLIVLVYVPFGLGLAAIGPFLLRYLVGPAFVSASFPMALLLGITAVFVPYTVLVNLAAGTRRTPALARASACALLANIALSIVLVPRIGIVGAALGNSAMSWAPFLALYLELRGTHLVRFDLRSLGRIWIAAGVMFVTVAVPLILLRYHPIFVFLMIAIGAALFLVLLRVVRAISADVANALIRFLPRWAGGLRPAICWVSACHLCGHDEKWSGPASPTAPSQK